MALANGRFCESIVDLQPTHHEGNFHPSQCHFKADMCSAGRNYNCHIPKGFSHLFAVYGFYAWAFEKKRKDNFKEIPILLWDKEVACNERREMGCCIVPKCIIP